MGRTSGKYMKEENKWRYEILDRQMETLQNWDLGRWEILYRKITNTGR
jgi:hypothetical protein